MRQQTIVEAALAILAGSGGLNTAELLERMRDDGVDITEGDLLSALSKQLSRGADNLWHPTPQERPPSATGHERRRRMGAWTEDQTVVVLWALPIVQSLTEVTGREFSAVAMKMANLLSVITGGEEGLANASNLDRAIVAKYGNDRAALEMRAASILAGGYVQTERALDVRGPAIQLLTDTGIPLHADIIAAILTARDPTKACTRAIVIAALRGVDDVHEPSKDVFAITNPAR